MQTTFSAITVAGSINHGAKQGKEGKERPVELGYFVAQVHDNAMQHLLEKFNSLYKESKEINISFPYENPYSERRVRNNQSGTVCYCLLDHSKGKEKIGQQWFEKDCSEECEHRMASKGKKPACLIEGILKFMIPEVSSDKIWYLKTKSYYSRQNIRNYINFQKHLNNSLTIGNYKLFLRNKENTIEGKTFHNFVLDIVKNDDFISNPISNKKTDNTTTLNNVKTVEKSLKGNKSKNVDTAETPTSPIISKEQPNGISIEIPKSKKTEPTEDDLQRYYVLIATKDVILNKNGKPTKYLEAKLCNKDSKEISAIIHPKYAKDMSLCELGSQFLMDIEEFGQRLIVNNCEYLVKQLKEAV